MEKSRCCRIAVRVLYPMEFYGGENTRNFSRRLHRIPCEIFYGVFIPRGQNMITPCTEITKFHVKYSTAELVFHTEFRGVSIEFYTFLPTWHRVFCMETHGVSLGNFLFLPPWNSLGLGYKTVPPFCGIVEKENGRGTVCSGPGFIWKSAVVKTELGTCECRH